MNTTTFPEQKRTPGEWIVRRSNDGSGDVGITVDGLPNVLAECFGAIRHSGERAVDEAMANARLIAAAPDMLAALKGIKAHMPDFPDAAWEAVDEAIAKAERS